MLQVAYEIVQWKRIYISDMLLQLHLLKEFALYLLYLI